MIDTLAFDFGNVIGLLDHGRTLAKLAPYTDMAEGEMFATIYGGDLEDDFESGRIAEEDFLRRFQQKCRLRCDEEFLAAAIEDIFWQNEPLCALIPRLKEHYRLVLGSNTNPTHARRFLAQFADTLRHFDGMVLSYEIGARKPGRAFYEEILRVAGCQPDRCVFIDDLPENAAGARACGLRGIVYTGMDQLNSQLRNLGVNPDAT
jgi:glucose-1-phosphatase